MSARLLLVEDEPGLVLTLTDRLEMNGYQVDSASDGETGLRKARENSYELILLDVMLPRKNGFEVCHEIRTQGITTPILMLTARDQLADKVQGLRTGADDYLTKPFEIMELLARVEALLRRARPAAATADESTLAFGPLEIDLKKTEVRLNGDVVNLTAKEFQLLRYLVQRRGRTISREELLEQVWGLHHIPSTRTVDVHVTWLRQKIEPNVKLPQFVKTVRGFGYRFES
jgi:two-component system alkaline phosphatase synthesis response regulator PhoP